MKNEALVSVVITTYGRTFFLEKAIESVIKQSYLNIEIMTAINEKNKAALARYSDFLSILRCSNTAS